jgi:hypothetical protein
MQKMNELAASREYTQRKRKACKEVNPRLAIVASSLHPLREILYTQNFTPGFGD